MNIGGTIRVFRAEPVADPLPAPAPTPTVTRQQAPATGQEPPVEVDTGRLTPVRLGG